MKAIRYHGPKKAFRLEDISRPEPQAGEVLVKITAIGDVPQRLSFLEAGTTKESKERIPKNLFLKTTAIGGRKWQN